MQEDDNQELDFSRAPANPEASDENTRHAQHPQIDSYEVMVTNEPDDGD